MGWEYQICQLTGSTGTDLARNRGTKSVKCKLAGIGTYLAWTGGTYQISKLAGMALTWHGLAVQICKMAGMALTWHGLGAPNQSTGRYWH